MSGRPMNLIEKLISNAVCSEGSTDVAVGDIVLLKVDWVLASELSWTGMDQTYTNMGRPSFARPDRFWLAADHIVDPRINANPKVRKYIDTIERIASEQTIDYQPPNTTIMHTDFVRERAQSGQMIIGADSHSCSAGAVGAFAMGLGSTDTLIALVTGRTFIEVPQVVSIRLQGCPPPGVGGKDVILHILGQLKRNTVAMERAVEVSGPGLAHLSVDARFAICNMMTEFGALTGVCTPDRATQEYIGRRADNKYKSEAKFFQADEGCKYADVFTIDLSQVSSLVALYPSPDNTIPAKELVAGQGLKLDGCFIGACTTAHEDLVLGALILEAAMKDGMRPVLSGKRKVTPGSRTIIEDLERSGLLDVYRQAGFDIGVPGCSYCVGLGADKASIGEVWLSSQNRNFKDRMGPGSIANLASAATVALSSFDMQLRDPGEYLNQIDKKRFARLCGRSTVELQIDPDYTAPQKAVHNGHQAPGGKELPMPAAIAGGVQRFGDNVDTDAISPGDLLMKASTATSYEEVGECCFYHDRPEYREKAANGLNVCVGGIGYGCGSSRESAAVALKGCGTKAIIAKSYSFIFRRNCANIALPALQLTDETFYEAVDEKGEGTQIIIDFDKGTINVAGHNQTWQFKLSSVDATLLRKGGAIKAYEDFGLDMYS